MTPRARTNHRNAILGPAHRRSLQGTPGRMAGPEQARMICVTPGERRRYCEFPAPEARPRPGMPRARPARVTNARMAGTFERVADLLEQQGAPPFRARAWREAASSIRDYPRELTDVFRDHGRIGLEAIPHIGPRLASVIIELVRTGRCGALDRLEGDPLASLLARQATGTQAQASPRHPSVELLLDIDRTYREAAAAGTLYKIAPRRFNPNNEAWLPILHLDRDGWSFTAMFSNTELAHRLGKTNDWVIIYFHEPHAPEAQATIVTEYRGALRGRRVVRGRERECAELAGPEPAVTSAVSGRHAACSVSG